MEGVIGLAAGLLLGAVVTAWLLARRRPDAPPTPRADEASGPDIARILAAIPDGVMLFDADGSTSFANDAAEALLGGIPTSATLVPIATLREALTDIDPPGRVELEAGAPPRVLQADIIAVDHVALLLILRDVTEARRAERIRTDFVANASHELKTPVASIQAVAETITSASRDDPAAVQRFTEQLERESHRLSRIVADLLDLSRLEAGPGSFSPVDLATVAAEEATRIAPDAEAAGLRLIEHTGTPAVVIGDERDLRLLVRNLLDNAVRHTMAGTITLQVEPRDGQVHLSVADTGAGIPQRDLTRIFERFYRVDRARARETGGTGLGLAIVKHIAESHDGSVSVQSELGAGSTFTVTLPVAPP